MKRRTMFLALLGIPVAAKEHDRVPVDPNDLNNFAHLYNAYVAKLKASNYVLNVKEDEVEVRRQLWSRVTHQWSRLER